MSSKLEQNCILVPGNLTLVHCPAGADRFNPIRVDNGELESFGVEVCDRVGTRDEITIIIDLDLDAPSTFLLKVASSGHIMTNPSTVRCGLGLRVCHPPLPLPRCPCRAAAAAPAEEGTRTIFSRAAGHGGCG